MGRHNRLVPSRPCALEPPVSASKITNQRGLHHHPRNIPANDPPPSHPSQTTGIHLPRHLKHLSTCEHNTHCTTHIMSVVSYHHCLDNPVNARMLTLAIRTFNPQSSVSDVRITAIALDLSPQLTMLFRPVHPRSQPNSAPLQPKLRARGLQGQDHRTEAVRYAS